MAVIADIDVDNLHDRNVEKELKLDDRRQNVAALWGNCRIARQNSAGRLQGKTLQAVAE